MMIKKPLCLLLVLLISSALFVSSRAEEVTDQRIDYFEPGNILTFADYLYERGDYLRAAGEYGRYLFSRHMSADTDSIYYSMIKAFFLAGDYDRCERLLEELSGIYPSSHLITNISMYRSVVRYHRGDYEGALVLARDSRVEGTLRSGIVSMSYLHLDDYEQAQKWACLSKPSDQRQSLGETAQGGAGTRLDSLCEKVRNADSLPHKNTAASGVMSAIIPGSGKIYCGRAADGIYSLVIVGLFAWQAIDGFNDDGASSVKGWVFGTLGAGFYLGNIYGSVMSAELYNKQVHNDFIQGLQIRITLP